MVVTSEVDACLPQTAGKAPSAPDTEETLSDQLSRLNVRSAAGARRATTVPARPRTAADGPQIDVIRAGAAVPQNALVELTTKSRPKWAGAYPQLFFAQTPHHYSAVHDDGRFHGVVKRNVGDAELKKVEAELQTDFQRLGRALRDIQELVVGHGIDGRLSLVYDNREIKVFERTSAGSYLPERVLGRFGN